MFFIACFISFCILTEDGKQSTEYNVEGTTLDKNNELNRFNEDLQTMDPNVKEKVLKKLNKNFLANILQKGKINDRKFLDLQGSKVAEFFDQGDPEYEAPNQLIQKTQTHMPSRIAKISILSVNPTTLQSSGNEEVIIQTNHSRLTLIFCKFNEKIIFGKSLGNGTILCKTPPLKPGEVALSVSQDQSKWSKEVILSVLNDENRFMTLIIILFVVVIVSVFGLLFAKLVCWSEGGSKKRTRKRGKQPKKLSKKSKEKLRRRKIQSEI